MSQEVILQLLRETMQTAILMGGPLLLVALAAGLLISMVQVVTSIHDPTLSFAPRLIAIAVTLLITLPWLMEKATSFTTHLFSQFILYAR